MFIYTIECECKKEEKKNSSRPKRGRRHKRKPLKQILPRRLPFTGRISGSHICVFFIKIAHVQHRINSISVRHWNQWRRDSTLRHSPPVNITEERVTLDVAGSIERTKSLCGVSIHQSLHEADGVAGQVLGVSDSLVQYLLV